MTRLEQAVINLWDGDVCFDTITSMFSEEARNKMELFLERHPEYIAYAPFPDECISYAHLIGADEGARLFQQMIERLD